MSPEAQRIAIAEACGWKRIVEESLILAIRRTRWIKPGQKQDLGFIPPDYLNDLNAMHEAVQSMSGQERKAFVNVLWCVVNPDLATKWDEASPLAFADYINATAAQRAEAFLRAKGLWKD